MISGDGSLPVMSQILDTVEKEVDTAEKEGDFPAMDDEEDLPYREGDGKAHPDHHHLDSSSLQEVNEVEDSSSLQEVHEVEEEE